MVAFVGNFQLSVTRALRDQLLTALGELDTAPLNDSNLERVENRPGVYQLFVNGQLVYVGKAARSLKRRLGQHYKKLGGRLGDILTTSQFKCVYVSEDLDAIAPETMLIAHYRDSGQAPWNFNGFGNNDPGKRRDTSRVASNHFDSLYPIDLDMEVEFAIASPETLRGAMNRLKRALPFVLRFDAVPAGLTIQPPTWTEGTVRDWIGHLAAALPAEWSVVALPGYVIAYPNRPAASFDSRLGAWQGRADGSFGWVAHQPVFGDPASETAEESESNPDDD